MPHPLASSPIIYLRMKGNNKPEDALIEALRKFVKQMMLSAKNSPASLKPNFFFSFVFYFSLICSKGVFILSILTPVSYFIQGKVQFRKRFRAIKPEIRVLGVDDGKFIPHTKGDGMVGVVFRGGCSIDGVMHTNIAIDGLDATEKTASMINSSPHRGNCVW